MRCFHASSFEAECYTYMVVWPAFYITSRFAWLARVASLLVGLALGVVRLSFTFTRPAIATGSTVESMGHFFPWETCNDALPTFGFWPKYGISYQTFEDRV